MAKKPSKENSVKASAKANASLVAKATYQRKRTTTEIIPPDVTRANASAWLDFISPITEWAGLKGDQLRAKRDLFRVQQEETLLKVAEAVSQKNDGKSIKPVVAKILVPALEKASLEQPSDDVMIDRWAELLSSASQDIAVQPRFVGILGELAGRQAECLELVAFNNFKDSSYPAGDMEESYLNFAQHAYMRSAIDEFGAFFEENAELDDIVDVFTAQLNGPGVFPQLILVHVAESDDWHSYDNVHATGERWESDFAILESLGLIREVAFEFDVTSKDRSRSAAWVSIQYCHLTQLGVEFSQVCSRARVAELEKVDAVSRANGIRRD